MRHLVTRPRSLALLASVALLSGLAPTRASACGGLFCSNPSTPINQTAERIVFAREADGGVTAIIEIRYSGPASHFAWVLPVAGSPTVNVSSGAALQRLQSATNPSYVLSTVFEGMCDGSRGGFFPGAADAGAIALADTSVANDGGRPPVTVVDSGSAGPYDYVVISVDPAATPLSTVAFEWLSANGYYVDASGAGLYQSYLEGGMNLIAFRLSSGNDVGSIRPIAIGFGPGLATIPIRPTAVAATDDMGMLVWVLGPSRAIPVNYRALEINEALINWLNPGSTYNDVVTAAANEAGGQGFVTEMAGDPASIAPSLWNDYEESNWASLRATTWTGREGELVANVLGQFGYLDGSADVIGMQLPLPTGVTLPDLLACVSCVYPTDTADIAGFDPIAFLDAFEAQVILPMRQFRGLFTGSARLTRFYTTMSASEMTMDPSFDFNASLPDVSSAHVATRTIECSPSLSVSEAPWRVELSGGVTVRGTGTTWPYALGNGMPANARILRVGTSGDGEVVQDNHDVIATALAAHDATIPHGGVPTGGGGCTASASGGDASALFAALGVLIALRLKRRRR